MLTPIARLSQIVLVTAGLLALGVSSASAGDERDSNGPMDAYTKSGLSPEELMKLPAVFFAKDLKDIPGKTLIIGKLEYPPDSPGTEEPPSHHVGPTYLYVTKGSMRLRVKGHEVQVISEGHGAFVPANTVLQVSSASAKESVSIIAFLINPARAPILIVDPAK